MKKISNTTTRFALTSRKISKNKFSPHTLFYYHMYYSVVPLWTPPPTLINEQKVCNIEKEIHVHSVINSKVVFGHFHSPISNFSSMTPPHIFFSFEHPYFTHEKKIVIKHTKMLLANATPKNNLNFVWPFCSFLGSVRFSDWWWISCLNKCCL